MAPHQSAADFYDDLTDDYHLIFADWNASITRQAAVITGLLRNHHGLTSGMIVDASCGIGTQAIGLALAGFLVTATDISPASVARCAREAAARGLHITTCVADIRVLGMADAGKFDAVVSFDNALAHLLDDADLGAACTAMRRVLRPGGALLASTRDYDTILRERPSGDVPRRLLTISEERIVFQVWEWTSDDRYTARHFIMNRTASDWSVTERRTTLRGFPRATISAALVGAGFKDIVWEMPDQTGFYQPVVSARSPTA